MQAVQQTESLAERAYAAVEELIVTLALPPGHVFSEGELSQRINIGRTPLREALQRLAADRLVKALPRKGMMISEINITDHLAMLETRRVLDQLVVSRAARRASDEQRAKLRAIHKEIQEAASTHDITAFMRLDKLCDEVLESASRNPFAAQALAPLHAHCRRFWYQYKDEGDITLSASLHTKMIEAVIAGDETIASEAADAVLAYLENFTRTALDLI